MEDDVAVTAAFDIIVVGQGLAGTTLALALQAAGQRVLVVDAEEPVTSSKIAAGLTTPITGQRLALSWRADEMLAEAQTFYASIEKATGQKFYHARTALRLFSSDAERELWSKRSLQPAFQTYMTMPQPQPLCDPQLGDAAGGGFEMRSAQLNVAAYLKAARGLLAYQPMRMDWARDVQFGDDVISVGAHKTRRLLSCEGHAAVRNPYFSCVPFKGAKGDILTVRFHKALPPTSWHRGIWIAPTADADVFRVGSTYNWQTLDCVPCADARAAIESKLQAFFRVPYTVIGHEAAVRPIIRDSKAVIGMHPKYAQLGFFNGLGSKGALYAPWFAKCFTLHLVRGEPIPAAVDVAKYF